MRLILRLLALFIVAISCFSGVSHAKAAWKKMNMASYDVYYLNTLPSTMFIEIASIATHLRSTIPDFIVSAGEQPVSIYLYPNKPSYVAGEFKPPEWSKGIQLPSKSTVVVYLTDNRDELIATLAHELTHLYIQKFFLEKNFFPPIWLDEGFAVLVEDSMFSKTNGVWTQIEKETDKNTLFDFNTILSEGPAGRSQEDINKWYTQAFSLVKFLRSKGNYALMGFCKTFRDTQDLPKALKKHYGYKNLDAFEKAWKDSSSNRSNMQTSKMEFNGIQSTRPSAIKISSF